MIQRPTLQMFLLFVCLLAFNLTLRSQEMELVPPDFGKDTTIILVEETERDKVNKEFEEIFEKYFPGSFLMIPASTYSDTKYKDRKKYRYVFKTRIKFVAATGMGPTRMPATFEYAYQIYDRETGKYYGLDQGSDSWKKLLKRYVAKLADQWKTNQKGT